MSGFACLAGRYDGGADEYLKIAKQLGIRAEMFTAEGQGHGFFNTEPWMSKTIPVVDDFLESLGYLNRVPSHGETTDKE